MRDPKNIPSSLNGFMQIYEDYENDFKNKHPNKRRMSGDYLQYSTYLQNPVTPFHQAYFQTKYSGKYSWIPYMHLLFSIILIMIYLIGLPIFAPKTFIPGLISLIAIFLIASLAAFYLVKLLNKWNWKYLLIALVFVIGIFYTILIILSFYKCNPKEIPGKFLSILGIAWAPTSFSCFIILKFKPNITDFGGIHLFLGWIYRVSETRGDINTLNSAFDKLINELDNWLNIVFDLVIKNKNEILENFYYNVISNTTILTDIEEDYKDLFEKILKGLLVEEILHSETFPNIEEEDKTIANLKHFDLVWLNYQLASKEFPNIIELIENISKIKLKVVYYSPAKKLKKLKAKLISAIAYIITTLLAPIMSLFLL